MGPAGIQIKSVHGRLLLFPGVRRREIVDFGLVRLAWCGISFLICKTGTVLHIPGQF